MMNESQTLAPVFVSSQLYFTASESAHLSQLRIKLYIAIQNNTNRIPVIPNQTPTARKLYLITSRLRE